MQKRLEIGSHVFIIESNRIITEVVVTANRGDFCVLRFPSGGAIQLRRSRIFASREDAEMQLPKNELEQGAFHRSPYYYGHWLEGMMVKKENEVHVACPCCKNRRLFDADPSRTEGVIKIKCPICKGVIAVSFHLKQIRTEQIGTRWTKRSYQGLTKYRCNITCILSGLFLFSGLQKYADFF